MNSELELLLEKYKSTPSSAYSKLNKKYQDLIKKYDNLKKKSQITKIKIRER